MTSLGVVADEWRDAPSPFGKALGQDSRYRVRLSTGAPRACSGDM